MCTCTFPWTQDLISIETINWYNSNVTVYTKRNAQWNISCFIFHVLNKLKSLYSYKTTGTHILWQIILLFLLFFNYDVLIFYSLVVCCTIHQTWPDCEWVRSHLNSLQSHSVVSERILVVSFLSCSRSSTEMYAARLWPNSAMCPCSATFCILLWDNRKIAFFF